MNVIGARPARFRRQRVLVVGCGDVGQRVVKALRGAQVLALTSSSDKVAALRALGVRPLVGNLDQPQTLQRLAGVATRVLHLAPPPSDNLVDGRRDPRTTALVRVLAKRTPPHSVVYGSTSGVYGDCAGDWVRESRAVNPHTPRAQRRVDAEQAVRWLGRVAGVATAVLRIPGIYAADRAGGTPRERLLRGTPALRAEDDVYTSHIHADDLARACVRALWQARAGRAFHVSDDTELRMGDYFDWAADLYGLPRPPRLARAELGQQVPLSLLSFMSESRRLDNTRLKRELRLRLRYPTIRQGLPALTTATDLAARVVAPPQR